MSPGFSLNEEIIKPSKFLVLMLFKKCSLYFDSLTFRFFKKEKHTSNCHKLNDFFYTLTIIKIKLLTSPSNIMKHF